MAARWGETGDDAKLQGVPGADAHDRYRRRCCLGRENRQEVARDNDGRRTVDQLSRQQRQTIVLALRPLGLDHDILALDKAGVSQAFTETGQRSCRGCGRGSTEYSNDRECRLLRARRKRPRSRTTQNAEETASPHGRHQVRELAAYRLSPVFDRPETGLTVDPSGGQISDLLQNRKTSIPPHVF